MTGSSTTNRKGRHITLLCMRVDRGYTITCAYYNPGSATRAMNNRNKDLLEKHMKECSRKGLDWEKYWNGDVYFTKRIPMRDYE
jgi:hypothetical protein